MTKREAAVMSAFTGIMIGEFRDMHGYAEEVLDRPIMSHEFANKALCEKLKEATRAEFMKINENITEAKEDVNEKMLKSLEFGRDKMEPMIPKEDYTPLAEISNLLKAMQMDKSLSEWADTKIDMENEILNELKERKPIS